MTAKTQIARMLFTSAGMALFIVYLVKPTVMIAPLQYAGTVVIIEIIAATLAYTISKNKSWRTIMQILALSFIFSAVILLAFKPQNYSFEELFIGTAAIEFIGLGLASAATSKDIASAI